ncbi:MAG: Mor transcription activator family protein [Rheinheimera sp.]|nr:Mor transcription activator family protein [Rheinheimera sp.]
MTENKTDKVGMAALRHELLDDVVEQAKNVLVDHGVDTDVSEQAATAIAEHLADHWGGQLINFPKNFLYKLAQRDRVIYDEFNGRNISDLARKFNMSVRGIYKVINRAQKRAVKEEQPDLFGD